MARRRLIYFPGSRNSLVQDPPCPGPLRSHWGRRVPGPEASWTSTVPHKQEGSCTSPVLDPQCPGPLRPPQGQEGFQTRSILDLHSSTRVGWVQDLYDPESVISRISPLPQKQEGFWTCDFPDPNGPGPSLGAISATLPSTNE